MWRSVHHINSKCLWWELSSVVTEDLSFISGLWNTKKWDFTWKLSWNHVQWKWVRVKQISDSKLFSVSWKPNVFLLFVRFSVRCLDVTNVSTGALDVSDRSGRGNATCRKHANDNCELSSSSFKCYLFIYLFMTFDCWTCWWTLTLRDLKEALSRIQAETIEMEEILGYFTRVKVVILHCKNSQTESPALQISHQ